MKRTIPILLILLAVAILVMGFLLRPSMGEVVETWETGNQSFKLHVERHAERPGWVSGAYYVFQAAPSGADKWRDIMIFRHDDPVPIPHHQVRFPSNRIGYVFMGWKYAVTTDGGLSWSVWNAEKDLPGWECCNYLLIKDVRLELDGTGTMKLNAIPGRRGEVAELHTTDFGRHWRV
jgi:hypothetical protein